jgi:hypothetical protein
MGNDACGVFFYESTLGHCGTAKHGLRVTRATLMFYLVICSQIMTIVKVTSERTLFE